MSAAMCVWFGPPASLLVAGQTARLRLVSTAWPPFTNPPGQPRFALDLVEEALDRIGVGATSTIVGPAQLLMRELHFALARTREDAESIVTRFNAQLRGMLADRTYHRLLHMDRIRGDIDGDGVPEHVPVNDRPGPAEPQHIYALFSPPTTAPETPAKPGFYLGGNIYSDRASVPESDKDVNLHPPDSRRSTASIFEFTW